MQITYRRVYKTLENFDLYGKYPSGVYAGTSARRGSYWQLNPAFREVVDIYKDTGKKRGLKDTTIYKTSFSASSFLLAMQKRSRAALNDITEDDVISYFIREGGHRPLNGGCRDTLAAVFKSDLGVHTEAARQILAYIPVIRQRRKNIPWVSYNFSVLWEKANGKKGNTVAYDFRHNYATANINSWADDVFGFNDRLHYLARSMGHRDTESTLYYYSVVPRLADMIQKKTEESFNSIVPEVDYEEE